MKQIHLEIQALMQNKHLQDGDGTEPLPNLTTSKTKSLQFKSNELKKKYLEKERKTLIYINHK